jgi:Spx/MgsR family transcriptional regulator
MAIKLYGYPKCSTCRKAEKYLQQRGCTFQSVDITEQPPTKEELAAMLSHSAGKLQSLFNTSGQMYRDMNLKEELPKLSVDAALELLSKHGKLIKRPFLVIDGRPAAVGFDESQWATVL